MTVYNLPDSVRAFVVARNVNGDLWFWGSWDDRDAAQDAAHEVNGIVIQADYIQ